MGYEVVVKKGSNVPLLDAGTYSGYCVGYATLGTQYNEKYQKAQERIIFFFEICGEFVEIDGEKLPRWQSKEYSISFGKNAKLTELLQSWFGVNLSEGDTLDFGKFVAAPCTVSVIGDVGTDGQPRRYIGAITPPMKGMQLPPMISERVEFSMFDDDKDAMMVQFEKLPEWVRKRIEKSEQWSKIAANGKEVDVSPRKAQAESETRKVPF